MKEAYSCTTKFTSSGIEAIDSGPDSLWFENTTEFDYYTLNISRYRFEDEEVF